MSMKSILVFACLLFITEAQAQVTITIDTTKTYQTIEGWGHGGDLFSNLNLTIGGEIGDSINVQTLDVLANDLGLTGSRMWEVGARIDGTGMDNGDCDSIDWSKFQVNSYTMDMLRYAQYFTQLVEKQGYKTSFYSSPTYPTFATAFKPWVLNHPGERAQQIWSNSLWWKQHGIDINYDVIYNEPSGVTTQQVLTDDIKAVGPRLMKLGLVTKSQYAEGVDPSTDWNYISPVQNDSELWKYVGRISYHNYGSADPYRAELLDVATRHGITTAQTEMNNPSIVDLYNDLVYGGVSYWEVAFAGPNTLTYAAGRTSFTPASNYFRLRQVLHYVRPGAVRIQAISNDPKVTALAFMQASGITVIVRDSGSTAKTFKIEGLPNGRYGLSAASPGVLGFQEYQPQYIVSEEGISFSPKSSGTVYTAYPSAHDTNYPPTIMTWTVNPGYVVSPASSAVLSVAASDPEQDSLRYSWTVYSQPSSANAAIVSPHSQNTSVTGLGAEGMYVFHISVSDGKNTSTRKLYLQVFATNPSPVLGQAGFRFAAPYGLVFTDPGDTTHVNIELPTSSATLQVGISDLANSNFTGRGKWTLISQPAGANVKLDTTIYIFVSIRANVSNMTVPGDYVFQCSITDPGHPDLVARVICTVHPQSSGPVIASIASEPSSIALPQDSVLLTAQTNDPQGQLLRHWWVVKSAPGGSSPTFDHQGRAETSVTGLTVPGIYTFTLRTFDDLHMTTKDVTLIVERATQNVQETLGADDVRIIQRGNILFVELSDMPCNAASIAIIDELGRTVCQRSAVAGQTEFNTSELSAGYYFMRLSTCRGTMIRLLEKQ